MPVENRLVRMALGAAVVQQSFTSPGMLLGDRLSLVLVDSWPIVVGAVFMAFVLFLPKGIWGTLTGGFHER